jgi:hypothetical protein
MIAPCGRDSRSIIIPLRKIKPVTQLFLQLLNAPNPAQGLLRLLVQVAYCCGNVFNGFYVNPKYTLVVHTIPPFHLKSTLHVPHPLKQRNK